MPDIMMLISGFRGWIGSALASELQLRGLPARGITRQEIQLEQFASPVIDPANAVAIHLAAIAHIAPGTAQAQAYEEANYAHCLRFARLCASAGVRRFIFVSSAKVLGDFTAGRANEQSLCHPPDSYSDAKRRAEIALLALHRPGAFEVSVLRPPLVYGPGVRANFLQLLRAANSALPLIASSNTYRSMVFLGNLVDALIHLAKPSSASGRVWFVSDPQELSMTQFLRALRHHLGRRAPVLSLPLQPQPRVRQALRGLPRLGPIVLRLTDSLQIDDSALKASGWTSPTSTDAALTLTAHWYLDQCKRS
jgi:nucleoside-diphosphate-sugar epimerase